MAEYQLYCFAQSGNAYRAALMLNLIGADWEPVWYDFFGTAPQRTPEFRETINEMGEAPVLVHGKKKLSQSGVILTYLANAQRQVQAARRGRGAGVAALDHLRQPEGQRFPRAVPLPEKFRQAAGRPGGHGVSARRAAQGALAIVNKRLTGRQFLVSDKPTIADISMTGYLYYPAEEFGFDIAKDHPAIAAWLDRMKALPGWGHPYDLMPGYPFGTQGYRNQ